MSLQGYWADLKAPDFRDLPDDLIAVLPVGAIEQHGPHLPVSVDRDLVDAVVCRTLDRLTDQQNVLILPTISVSKSGEHGNHPGTLALSTETLLAILRETARALANASVQRIVLFNGHGGNTALLEIAARDFRIDHDLIAATCSWFSLADYDGVVADKDLPHDIHGGEVETSAMLAAHPEKVDMQQAENFKSATVSWQEEFQFIGLTGQAARPGWIIDDLNDCGACGDASAATHEKGERLLNSAAENFALMLAEFARFDGRRGV